MGYYSYETGKRFTIDSVNALIDWYEKHRPEAGRRIEVNVTPRTLARAIGHQFDPRLTGNEFQYRNRTLVAIGRSK